ncbi:leucyl aminopeptidase family protein, partial [Deinococcus aquaticus]
MPLVQKLERPDLTLTFVGRGDADRVTRDLKPGEVRLRARSESHDEAAALMPQSPGEAREVGEALARLAR